MINPKKTTEAQRAQRFFILAFSGSLGWMPFSAWAQGSERPWSSPAEAGWLYWLLVVLVGGGILAFALWALYARRREPERPSTARYHALGALVIALTLFTLVLYLIVAFQAQSVPATERAWDWSPDDEITDPGGSDLQGSPYRGYLVYLANGCTYCHTLYLRPEDVHTGWGEGATEADVSRMGDFVHYPFALLGTQRDGPDLTLVGRKIPDMRYQIDHLKAPRRFKPRSIMPQYDYLSERDLQDLAAFLVSLGNPPRTLRTGAVVQPQPPGLSELAQQGRTLYRSLGCVGCHSVDGSPNAGPTWKDLYGKQEALADGSTVPVDAAYLEESIRDPKAKVVQGYANIMPPFPNLSAEEISALIAFIEALSSLGPSAPEVPSEGSAGATSETPPTPTAEGMALVEGGRQLAQTRGCLACHSVDGSVSVGPTWKGLYGKQEALADGTTVPVDEAYLRESILDPSAKLVEGFPPAMPPYTFSDEELRMLIAYLESLAEE